MGDTRKLKPTEIARVALKARWGDKRGPSSLIRVDKGIAELFRKTVKERDRRALASAWLAAGIHSHTQVGW